jgi:hypothetical protein
MQTTGNSNVTTNSKDNKLAQSPAPANLIVSRGSKPGQKSMKIVYKQVRDSSEKGLRNINGGGKTFDES